MATLKDIAQLASVSIATCTPVSYIAIRVYLSQKETRHRILTVAEELGYTKHLKQAKVTN